MARDPACQRCPLHATCSTVCVWGEGNPKSSLMLVLEAPGTHEDAAGVPLMGRAGDLLDYCLERISVKRSQLYVTNAIKCRPLDGKLPGKKEVREGILQACSLYLNDEFQQLKPKVVLALGKSALQVLSEGKMVDVSSAQGRGVGVYTRNERDYTLVASYHPNFVLMKPAEERRLTAALSLACRLAGIRTQWNPPLHIGDFFDYDYSR